MDNERIVIDLLGQFERGKISRRHLVQSLVTGMAATSAAMSLPALAAAPSARGLKATAVNHISYGVADYGRTRDFYASLLGMRVSEDTGTQCALSFGDTFILARKTRQPDNKPYVDHIAYTIDNWDKDAVEAELRRRGFDPRPDTDDSFHVKDPDGFGVQIAGKNMKAAP
jgi:catechol 2,3-dioxygenase-like lactoylglutathione lyase family enzyme